MDDFSSLVQQSLTAPPAVLTREMLGQAFDRMREREHEETLRRAERAVAWLSLKLDWKAMTPEEQIFLGYCMEAEIVHPNDAKRAEVLVERYRRDR